MGEAAVYVKHINIKHFSFITDDHDGGTDKLFLDLGVHLLLLDVLLVLDVDDEDEPVVLLLHGGQVHGAGDVG